MILDGNKEYHLALDHLCMTASWHNIRSEHDNSKLKIAKDYKKQRFIVGNNNIFIRYL